MDPAKLPQQTIKVAVDFYSEEDKNQLLLLLENDTAAKKLMMNFVANGVEISVPDFLFFYLFHLMRRGNPLFQTKEKIRENLHKALEFLEGWIEWDGISIRTLNAETDPTNEIREHIGEAIGLAVASKIHKLSPADWNRIIPEPGQGNTPRFDFEIAASDNKYIQIENKGSVVADNRNSQVVNYHKKNIKERKGSIAEEISKGSYPFSASLRYGTIGAIDPRPGGLLKCWLADPPVEEIHEDPKRFKLLTRLRFLRDWISVISPNSQLATAISVRVAELETLPNPFIFDNKPLRTKKGEIIDNKIPFNFFQFPPPLSRFFSKKSRVTDGPTGGVVVQISDNELFFIGVFQELISLAVSQDFQGILEYEHKYPWSGVKTIKCVFNRYEFEQLRLPQSVLKDVRGKKNIFSFYLDGQMHFSSSGFVFGVLPLKLH